MDNHAQPIGCNERRVSALVLRRAALGRGEALGFRESTNQKTQGPRLKPPKDPKGSMLNSWGFHSRGPGKVSLKWMGKPKRSEAYSLEGCNVKEWDST